MKFTKSLICLIIALSMALSLLGCDMTFDSRIEEKERNADLEELEKPNKDVKDESEETEDKVIVYNASEFFDLIIAGNVPKAKEMLSKEYAKELAFMQYKYSSVSERAEDIDYSDAVDDFKPDKNDNVSKKDIENLIYKITQNYLVVVTKLYRSSVIEGSSKNTVTMKIEGPDTEIVTLDKLLSNYNGSEKNTPNQKFYEYLRNESDRFEALKNDLNPEKLGLSPEISRKITLTFDKKGKICKIEDENGFVENYLYLLYGNDD